jgi:predicted alpha/beta-hydrolase family hydrolase
MTETNWRVDVDGGTVSAVFEEATVGGGEQRALFVCAHGAGGSMSDRGMLSVTKQLRGRGFDIVRFNFPYTERGSGRPDPMPKLEQCVSAVAAHARGQRAPRLTMIGGRSMGGRAASMLAASGFDVDGVLLLAYPLHPAGQPEKLRDAHLGSIPVPVLCLNGTRDELCRPDLMEAALVRAANPRWRMHWLDGADHSFHVLKSSGRNDAAVLEEVGDVSARWLRSLTPRSA